MRISSQAVILTSMTSVFIAVIILISPQGLLVTDIPPYSFNRAQDCLAYLDKVLPDKSHPSIRAAFCTEIIYGENT